MRPLVLITGAAGLIGRYLVTRAARWAPRWDLQGVTRGDAELTDPTSVGRIWASIKPDAVIHCAALSRTKECEQDPDRARRENVAATVTLAQLARDIPFLFLSSGEVFDGKAGWYRESDNPCPSTSMAGRNSKRSGLSWRILDIRSSGSS